MLPALGGSYRRRRSVESPFPGGNSYPPGPPCQTACSVVRWSSVLHPRRSRLTGCRSRRPEIFTSPAFKMYRHGSAVLRTNPFSSRYTRNVSFHPFRETQTVKSRLDEPDLSSLFRRTLETFQRYHVDRCRIRGGSVMQEWRKNASLRENGTMLGNDSHQ